MRLINQLFLYFMVLVTLQACTENKQETVSEAAQSKENLRDIAYDAFIYAYPLMEQVKTVNGMVEYLGLQPNKVAMNTKLPWESVGMPIVAPNLTSMTGGVFIDISNGPVSLEIPEVKDRYIVYQCIDVFTHNFFYLGTRGNSGEAGRFVFYNHTQALPKSDAIPVLMEGDHAIIVVRIAIDNESEYERVRSIQDVITIVDAPDKSRDYPTYDESKAFSPEFVGYLNELLTEVPATEKDLFKRFAAIGVMSDVKLTTEQKAEVQAGIDAAFEAIKQEVDNLQIGNGYLGATETFGTREYLNKNYLGRAAGAHFGLWGNSKEEANYFITMVEGEGEIVFTKEQLPPLTEIGFWSITAHDENMLVKANEYDSYVITMDKMVFDDDGSLVVNFSNKPQEGNWLYTPGGKMAILIRAYQADSEQIGGYVPPAFKPTAATETVTPQEARKIAKEAYIFGFPMVMNYKTLFNYAIDKNSPEYKGPLNHLSCTARLFTPEDKAVVTPNADTPYCMFWMDLRAEPLVLTVPEMEPERFYHFQLIDLYTHNFAYVGTLTSGNGGGKFLLAGPDWDGEKPGGVADVIRSETGFIFNITRTQLFGPDDLPKVKEIQGSYDLQSLSAFLREAAPAAAPTPDFPVWVEGSQFDERMFSYLDFMLSLLEKPLEEEKPLWDRFARLGLGPGNEFDFTALPPEIQEALKEGAKEGFGEIEKSIGEFGRDPLGSAKIFGTREFLQNSAKANFGHENQYLIRAAAGHVGLYGNSAAEAIYPAYLADSDGRPYDASANKYTIRFEKGQLPPVRAFWSLTVYDGKTQLFIENPLDRYLLNSAMMDQFKIQDDGSLVLRIGKDSPGGDREPNWLPAPDGPFYLVMRLYGPKPKALEGKWTPPDLQKVE